jgi:hypothetical protein
MKCRQNMAIFDQFGGDLIGFCHRRHLATFLPGIEICQKSLYNKVLENDFTVRRHSATFGDIVARTYGDNRHLPLYRGGVVASVARGYVPEVVASSYPAVATMCCRRVNARHLITRCLRFLFPAAWKAPRHPQNLW